MDFNDGFSEALAAGNIVALPLALLGGLVGGDEPLLSGTLSSCRCCMLLYAGRNYQAASWQCRGLRARHRRSCGIAWNARGLYRARGGDGDTFQIRRCFSAHPHGRVSIRLDRLPLIRPKAFRPGIGGAFGTGLLLSLIIGPCGTPVLVAALSFAVYKQSFIYRGLLLFLYGIGNGLPVMLVGTASGSMLKRLDCSRFGNWIDPIVGGLLILLGFYLLWRISDFRELLYSSYD